ncbi:MAG: ABC transporter ATP-binding protein [Pelolinea sp.]|nr:ABC transporter ATP-binding protein [Pelolinea sp.]
MTLAIETHQITKLYGDTVANDHIDFSVIEGHIHAVLGENGAGKTTLVKILFGEEMPTEGEIKIFGKTVTIHNPAEALDLSIGFIHQHFTLVNEFTIAQNFALGIEPCNNLFFCDYDTVNKKVKNILDMLEMPLKLDVPVGSFSVEERQIMEIGKALYRGAQILILDEPTSVLTPQKIEKLLDILRKLRQEGKTIIMITHKLEEAFSIADEISVLRKGVLVATLPHDRVNREQLIRMMVGEEPLITLKKEDHPFGDALVQVRNLCVNNYDNRIVKNVSFEIHRGEIFGLTGVGGNGQAELVEALIGMRPASEGDIRFDGKSVVHWDIQKRRLSGMAYVPENRIERGAAVSLSILDNLVMGHHYLPEFHQGLLLKYKNLQSFARDIIKDFEVVASSLEINAGSLSGGNLQKLIIGREFSLNTPFLIVAYPSQGIDIRTTKYVHSELIRRRDTGYAILLVSGDMDEIFNLSDRIGVMYSGELVAITKPEEINRFELGQYMVGSRRNC